MDWIDVALGAVLGALGMYVVNKCTDQRREKEAIQKEQRLFDDLCRRFPAVLQKMEEDVNNPEFESVQTFFLIKTGLNINAPEPSFLYYLDKLENLRAAVDYMEELGYVKDITPGNVPKYRMTEEFIDLLRQRK